MFCLTCRKLSPSGSAFCAHCQGGRAFNAVLCGGGHRCHVGSRVCPACGRDDFSEHTRGIPTGWIPQIVTVSVLVALWKIGLAHGGSLLSALGTGVAYAFGLMTNSDGNALRNLLRMVLAWGFTGWVFGLFLGLLPGGGGTTGKFLRRLPAWAGSLLLRLARRLLPLLWRGVVWLSGIGRKPVQRQGPAKGGRNSGHSHSPDHGDD